MEHDALYWLRLIAASATVINQGPGAVRKLREAGSNAATYFREFSARVNPDTVATGLLGGTPLFALVERLDDGTDTEHQHLRLYIAPEVPDERKDNALECRAIETIQDAMRVLWFQAYQQAIRDAEPGEERTTTVVAELWDDVVSTTTTIRGHVGGEWESVAYSKGQFHLRQFLASANWMGPSLRKAHNESKARRKAERQAD